ncbi:hypothetical protein P154DRAFT_538171 [Amniculicola lignicola CBS 123094]|uniref:BZIP domain-containing protein n=1 Tax=Amniculicola lignicola CBS 123094 TaxID=1392246 RepID=A0A6A5WET7_9PLEO|nr:hypothetical protein P154DRAFT_538171 [Amniculicola lignicola CBS 123094]
MYTPSPAYSSTSLAHAAASSYMENHAEPLVSIALLHGSPVLQHPAALGQYAPVATESNRVQMASQNETMVINDQKGRCIPAEVGTGSKEAGEKRKRNAKASARFRARQGRLERELCETLKTMERYKAERDYFRSLVPDAERQHAKPLLPSNASSPQTAD